MLVASSGKEVPIATSVRPIIGNVLGSSLFNILAVLSLTAIIKPVQADPQIITVDAWVMLSASILLIPFLWSGKVISRTEGAIMLILYFAYTGWIYTNL